MNISRKKGFLDEIKSIFNSFLKDYQKIADISFKEKCACVYVQGILVCQIRAGDVMVGGLFKTKKQGGGRGKGWVPQKRRDCSNLTNYVNAATLM